MTTLVPMAYEVSTAVFEGPFDLLLHLILREQVDLYEVSLSAIVDAYLAELERMEALDLELATEFLLIAATLVELKTRRLLPGPTTSTSTRSWPCGRSATCCWPGCSSARRSRTRRGVLAPPGRRRRPARSPRRRVPTSASSRLSPTCWTGVTPTTCGRVRAGHGAQAGAARRPRPRRPDPAVSVAEAVEELIDELPRAGAHHLPPPHRRLVERLEVIVRFLAVLELYKQGLVELDQADDLRRHRDRVDRRRGWPATAGLPWRRRRRLRGLSMSDPEEPRPCA